MQSVTPGAGKPVILIIEDEADLREDLVEELEDAGYSVVEASDGIQAQECLSAMRPDLILCDVSMPDCDGYELLRLLRETRPDLADVPFVFLTAQATNEQIVRGKRAGADDYLTKPVDFELMLATIHSRIGQMLRVQLKLAAHVARINSGFSVQHERVAKKTFRQVAQTLDYVASGIVLLDAEGHVQFANSTAMMLVATTGALRWSDITKDTGVRDAAALKRAVRACIAANRAGLERTDGVSLHRTGGLRDLLIVVCALAGDGPAQAGDAVVAMFVSDSGYRPPAPVAALKSLFGLTPAESRIAWAFVEGRRVDDIAEHLGISPTTVAFHKRNIFQKTNTNRQVDLIALLLALPISTPESHSIPE